MVLQGAYTNLHSNQQCNQQCKRTPFFFILSPALIACRFFLMIAILNGVKYYCFSVEQLCLTPCNPMNCTMPGITVLHYLLDFAQTHVH